MIDQKFGIKLNGLHLRTEAEIETSDNGHVISLNIDTGLDAAVLELLHNDGLTTILLDRRRCLVAETQNLSLQMLEQKRESVEQLGSRGDGMPMRKGLGTDAQNAMGL